MSRDIRSFFTPLKKSGENAASKQKTVKPTVVIDSDDDDVIISTPDTKVPKSKTGVLKRKLLVISSDSEEEVDKKRTEEKGNKKIKEQLKPVNIDDVFNDSPIKQSKIEHIPKTKIEETPKKDVQKQKKRSKKTQKTELGIHDDTDFEKTLLDLDDDVLIENVDVLDKTIEEAMNESHTADTKKVVDSKQSTSKTKSPKEKKKNTEESIVKETVDLSESPEVEQSSSKEDTPHKKSEKKRNRESSKEPTPKKQKLEHSDSGIDPDQEAFEKRRYSAALYQKYLQRGGPKHHGEKEIPKGKPDCLKNLTFLRTGVLDSLESNEFEDLVKEHGGRVVHAVSSKISAFIELGQTGMKPMFSQQKSDISVESGIDMEDHPPKGKKKKSSTDEELDKKQSEKDSKSEKASGEVKRDKKHINLKALSVEKPKSSEEKSNKDKQHENKSKLASGVPGKEKRKIEDDVSESNKLSDKTTVKENTQPDESNEHQKMVTADLSWTEKYKPTSITGIIGQQSVNSNMNKLMHWLKNWNVNRTKDVKRPSPWAQHDDGAYFKAALLSGPPGVGKTTTATLVCQTLGYDIVEFNASDTRSKKLLHEEVSQLLRNTSISSFAAGQNTTNRKRVLLMDEVDGMAGNEDRGGIQELMNLIKTSNFPIICMCNDRNHAKLRSFVNHCFELKFSKPKAEQIVGAMLSVCFKEGIKISPKALLEIITGTGCDIRQTLNHLTMWSAAEKNVSFETAQKESEGSKKGPWEVARKVFTRTEHEKMSLADKSRLFFFDYSIGPLFVQENYLSVVPKCDRNKMIKRVALAADAISMGDLVDSKIRGSNNWALLESQAIFASVLPGHYMSGHINARINFPGWLGKNSSANKHKRMLSELHMHTRMRCSGNRMAMNLDYLVPLRNAIINPLKKLGGDGVPKAIDVMKGYNLLREDLDNLIELTVWKGGKNPFNDIESKVSAKLFLIRSITRHIQR
nr:unnamed protein product [Callosobruchus chinensis]